MPITPHANTDSGARIPQFVGALNFRDMGGYPTRDGRIVRWHQLYRSGTTHCMTAEDLQLIVSRGVRFVHDLRSNAERFHHPNRLEGLGHIEYGFLENDRGAGDLLRLIRKKDAQPQDSRALMCSLYRELPYEARDSYRAIFAHLAHGDLPLVFNCELGKDRTGVAAALVLAALGVPRNVIFEDYLMTDVFYDRYCKLLLRNGEDKRLEGADPGIVEPMLRADAAYLESMFAQLIATHGSTDAYLQRELGLDDACLEDIRSQLLIRA